MSKTMTRLLSAALLLLAPVLAACDKNVHADIEFGLAVGMEWSHGTEPVEMSGPVNIWIYDDNGDEVVSRRYASPQELAAGTFSLPAGNYTVVGTCGLDEPYLYGYEDGKARADALRISLADPSASPRHAIGGVASASITGAEANVRTIVAVAPLLSELSVTIGGTPKGATLSATAANTATAIYPARTNDGGSGITPSAAKTAANLPAATSEGGAIQTTARLMPTAQGEACTMLGMTITLADGTCREFTVEAPAMLTGKRYELTLEYAEIKPYMHIKSTTINDWTEGWSTSEDIYNPG